MQPKREVLASEVLQRQPFECDWLWIGTICGIEVTELQTRCKVDCVSGISAGCSGGQ